MADEPEIPIMAGPPPVLESERRNIWTWIVLGGIFLVLVGGSLYSYFSPEHEEVAAGDAEIVSLKVMVAANTAFKTLLNESDESSRKSLEKSMAANEDQIRKANREAAAKIAANKSLSKQDARVLLALGEEAGDEPNSRALDLLSNSEKQSDQAVATIYESKTLDPTEAETLAPKGSGFLDRLAAAHAKEKAGIKDARAGLVNFGAAFGLVAGLVGAVAALLIGTIVLLYHFFGIQAGARPKGLPIPHLTKAASDRLALRMALYLAGFIGLGIGLRALPLKIEPIFSQVLGLAAVAAFVFVMLAVPLFGVSDPLTKVAGKKPKKGILGPALAGWMSNAPVMLAMILVSSLLLRFLPTPSHPVQQEIATTTDPLRLAMIFLTASVFAPLIEETTFRGLLFPALTALTGKPWIGMLVSGFLFAAIHPQGPALWPALAGLGVLMAYLTYWTGSIVPGMILHGLHNGAILAFSLMLNSL